MSVRARAGRPEAAVVRGRRARASAGTSAQPGDWGALPVVAILSAAGLLIMAAAFHGARSGAAWAEPLYWTALVALVLPVAGRMTSPAPGRRERIGLIAALGLSLYLVKVMQYPLDAAFHDELGHLRSTLDIARTDGLFASNPIVRAYPFYPGLEIVTNAVSELSGMTPYTAGLTVLGAARLALGVALYHVLSSVARSNRVGGLAAVIYMASPSFVLFDSLFAYESLALPLAALVLGCLLPWRGQPGKGRAAEPAAGLLILALVATHHMTAYALTAFLALWTVVHYTIRKDAVPRPPVAILALAAAASAAWLIFVSKGATSNLAGIVGDAFTGLADLVPGGSSSDKQLFTSGTGRSDPLLERVVGFATVIVILGLLSLGLLRIWKGGRQRPLVLVLALAAAVYPATLLLRLTAAGTETSSRLSAFVFLGIGLVIAIVVDAWLRRRRGRRGLGGPAFALCAALLIAGGVVIGVAPGSRLPGPYLVGADARSVEPQGVQAARWTRRVLGPDRRMAADLTNSLLLAAYGGQETVRGEIDGVPVPTLFFSTLFGQTERTIIQGEKLDYLVVDSRLTEALPRSGRYFEGAEPEREPDAGPLPKSGVEKFDGVEGISRIYDAGDLRIYDVRPVAGGARP